MGRIQFEERNRLWELTDRSKDVGNLDIGLSCFDFLVICPAALLYLYLRFSPVRTLPL